MSRSRHSATRISLCLRSGHGAGGISVVFGLTRCRRGMSVCLRSRHNAKGISLCLRSLRCVRGMSPCLRSGRGAREMSVFGLDVV